jgi:hypothetical protein
MGPEYSTHNTPLSDYLSVTESSEAIEETTVVDAVIAFANGAELPVFLRRLPGAFHGPAAGVIDRVTGASEATGIEARRESVRRDMVAIADGRLTRARKKEIATAADRVTVEIKGSQRRMRPAFLRTPDLQAAFGYVLHLIATHDYGRRLVRCKLPGCLNLFLREARRARPEIYCSSEHAKDAKDEASRKRALAYRNRLSAISQLKQRYPSKAGELVKAVAEPGLSIDELVRRATEHAARKHK